MKPIESGVFPEHQFCWWIIEEEDLGFILFMRKWDKASSSELVFSTLSQALNYVNKFE